MQSYVPGPVRRPPATSTTGPKITVAFGVVALLGAIALMVVGGLAVARILPTDVLRMDGSPGDAVVGVVDAPGTREVDLEADTAYAVYLVEQGTVSGRAVEPVVTGPDGEAVDVGTPSYSSQVTMGSTHARATASFTTGAAGTYTIEATTVEATEGVDRDGVRVFIVEDGGLGGFLGGLFGGVAGLLGGVFLGLVAVALLVTGGVMWGVRRGNARRAAGLR